MLLAVGLVLVLAGVHRTRTARDLTFQVLAAITLVFLAFGATASFAANRAASDSNFWRCGGSSGSGATVRTYGGGDRS